MFTNSDKPNGRGGEPTLDFPDLRRLPRPPLGRIVWVVLAGVAVFLAVSSYYQIAPYETGVVLRFGKFAGLARPGPNFKLPIIDAVYKVPTERQLKEEFGFRTLRAGQRTVYDEKDHPEESLMLTGDLNMAEVQWVVQYRIRDPLKFLFQVRNVQETIRAVAEAEMRGVVGDKGFNEVIKTGRQEIEVAVHERLSEILTDYGTGVEIKLVQLQDAHPPDPVKNSFEEVNRSLQEMERSINEALQERNKVLFRVEGEAKQRVAEAEGTKTERVNRAQGDAQRFDLLLAAYRESPQVTRQRLYLEAMQAFLPGTGRILVVDESIRGAAAP